MTDLSVDERVKARERFSANIHHPDAVAEFGDPQTAYTPEECFDQGFITAREYSKQREKKLRETLRELVRVLEVTTDHPQSWGQGHLAMRAARDALAENGDSDA